MNDIPDGMVATERFQNYENNLKNGAELLRDRKLPTNNKTYGQLITDDELKALEKDIRKNVRTAKKEAWNEFLNPHKKAKDTL